MIRRVAMSVVLTGILCAASAHAQDEAGCISARYSAGGKYAGCEAKAAAKEFDEEAFLKCRQKYAATWSKLGARYPGTSCTGARLVDNGDGTITDNLTLLVWEKKNSSDAMENLSNPQDVDNHYSWSTVDVDANGTAFTDFLATLNSTGFAGQHDWRMPTLFELHTIVATDAVPCGPNPCVSDPILLPAQGGFYWSSSTYQDDPTTAWTVDFLFGHTLAVGLFKTDLLFIRAVRAGS